MSHSTVSTIKNLVISARFNCCRKTSIKLTQSKSQKAKEKISQQILRKRTTQKRHSVIENTTSVQASVVMAALFSVSYHLMSTTRIDDEQEINEKESPFNGKFCFCSFIIFRISQLSSLKRCLVYRQNTGSKV